MIQIKIQINPNEIVIFSRESHYLGPKSLLGTISLFVCRTYVKVQYPAEKSILFAGPFKLFGGWSPV